MPESPQSQKTKEEMFTECPDNFVDRREIIAAVGRSDKGMTLLLNAKTRSEAVKALAEMQVALLEQIFEFDSSLEKSKVHPAKGGIINFAKERFKR